MLSKRQTIIFYGLRLSDNFCYYLAKINRKGCFLTTILFIRLVLTVRVSVALPVDINALTIAAKIFCGTTFNSSLWRTIAIIMINRGFVNWSQRGAAIEHRHHVSTVFKTNGRLISSINMIISMESQVLPHLASSDQSPQSLSPSQ